MEIQIILLIILISFSAFFSSSETVLYLVKDYFFNKKSKNYSIYSFIKRNEENILPLILFSNTVVNIFIGLLTENIGYKLFPTDTNIFIIIIGSTIILLIFGEILPKKIGISLHKIIYPFNFFILYYLFIFLKNLNKIISFFLKPFFKIKKENNFIEQKEIILILNDAFKNNLINYYQYKLFLNVINTKNRLVKDIMIPYKYVLFINDSMNLNQIYSIFLREYNFFIPVYYPDKNFILGYIDKRDFINYINEEYGNISNLLKINNEKEKTIVEYLIKKFIRKPEIIYEKANLSKVLDIIFNKGEEIIFVIDEYFQFSGIVFSNYLVNKILNVNLNSNK
ncbi:MAG: CNNM domain-containing protein [Spirochaetes bacterium]|nr:CNNM domain-containing protein [Spirochaetota bacterium]